jgi:hypothetical protein
MKLIHWLFDMNNPFQLYGFWPAFLWTVAMIVVGFTFFLLEGMGLARFHTMIPLTWYWRCAPRIIWIIIAIVGFWHFALVVTKIK